MPGSMKPITDWKITPNDTATNSRAIAKRSDPLALQVKSYIDNGKLLPDQVMNDIMQDVLPQECIVDAFTRSVGQSKYLDSIRHVRAFINLTIPEPEIKRRIAERRTIEGRADDTPEALAVRIGLHQERAPDIIAHYDAQGLLYHIDGDQPINEVTKDILRALSERIPDELQQT